MLQSKIVSINNSGSSGCTSYIKQNATYFILKTVGINGMINSFSFFLILM